MKKGILSLAFALCIGMSSQSVASAWQEGPLRKGEALTEESAIGSVSRDSVIPTPAEAYEAMIALKEKDEYKEGTPWTDFEPYSDEKGYYHWRGGLLDGKRISAVGCVAFAFILSDAAFGDLPARMYEAGKFTYEDIKAGDILRVNNDRHTLIVLEVDDAGVVVAEGNISDGDHKGKVHWGRAISRETVMRDASHYITRYPEGYIPPSDPDANLSIASGALDGGLAWNLTKAGALTVSGKGAMPDFSSIGDQPWGDHSGQIRKVLIEDGVTGIGSCAFWGCGALSVEISSSVTAIGNSAFRGSSIVSVTVPSSVKTIGDSAFRECPNLSLANISEGVEKIDQSAFRASTKLASIHLPASIGEVGSAAFYQCQALTEATFAPGSKQVKFGDNIFTQCYYLMKVTLPKSIDCIGEGMFQNCLMLPGVEIPQGAERIGGSAFASCSAFTTVIIPDSVTSIGIAAFASCPLRDIYFTGDEAQWSSVSKIGDTAAAVLKAKMHYNFVPPANPDPGDGDDNENPGGDKPGDGENPGDDKPGDGENPGGDKPGDGEGPGGDKPGDGEGPGGDKPGDSEGPGGDKPGDSEGPGGDKPGDGEGSGGSQGGSGSQEPFAKGKTFTVGQETYQVTKVGEEVELTASKSTAAKVTVDAVTGTDGVKYKVTSIGSGAMKNNKKLTGLVIGSNVKAIGTNAFSGCTKLMTVAFGKNVESIGVSAFKGCAALKKTLSLPDSVKAIGANAFYGCKKITAAVIGKTSKSSLKTIGKSAFNGCKKLGKVTVKSTKLSSVGKQAFKGTKSSLKVKAPSKLLKQYKRVFKKAGLKEKQIIK